MNIHNPELFTMYGTTREFAFGNDVSPRPVSSLYSQDARSPTLRPEPLASVQSLQSLDRWLEKLLDTLAARYEERQALRIAWTASEESIRNLKYQFYISRAAGGAVQGQNDARSEGLRVDPGTAVGGIGRGQGGGAGGNLQEGKLHLTVSDGKA
ncbi:hypothetical protein DL546_009846 [Coniochaeta pulveracea]|uniref:Uncharacterized protein n=1 Tax=Coniochaeta pulveracea TaxID=177199 RepID=A0A420YNE5_9PEZI|nr:hypothetical protein DL546_009846 [Coniochaeta pulveracea]